MTDGTATMTAAEVADAFGVSLWTVYEHARRGDFPVAPLQVGRRYVWPRSLVLRALGVDGSEAVRTS